VPDDVRRFGKVPPLFPVPDHVTRQSTVAVTGKDFSRGVAVGRPYVYPQVGDNSGGCTDGSDGYGVPGPRHVTLPPSPIDHATDTGSAVAVTDTPPTDALAVTGAHDAAGIESQSGIPTSSGRVFGGLMTSVGVGGFSCL